MPQPPKTSPRVRANQHQPTELEAQQPPGRRRASAAQTWLRTHGLRYLLGVAMLAAPAIGALYGLNVALGIATIALVASTTLALHALPIVAVTVRPRLKWLAAINAVLALVCGAVWVLRVFG